MFAMSCGEADVVAEMNEGHSANATSMSSMARALALRSRCGMGPCSGGLGHYRLAGGYPPAPEPGPRQRQQARRGQRCGHPSQPVADERPEVVLVAGVPPQGLGGRARREGDQHRNGMQRGGWLDGTAPPLLPATPATFTRVRSKVAKPRFDQTGLCNLASDVRRVRHLWCQGRPSVFDQM